MTHLVTSSYLLTIILQLVGTTMIPQHSHCQAEIAISNANNYTTCDKKASFRMGLHTPNAYCSSRGICLDIELENEYQITGISLQGYQDFTYGTETNIYLMYYDGGKLVHYKHAGMNPMLKVQGRKGNDIEYLTLKPFFSSKIKIQFPDIRRKSCLRMTLHGCKQPLIEYNKCASREAILERYHSGMKFTETKAEIQDIAYKAEYLILTQPHAWCLVKSNPNEIDYAEWATIDLTREYIIYGLVVKGYMFVGDKTNNDEFMTRSIRFQYSVDGKIKSDVENTQVWSTVGNLINFDMPILAKFLHVSMLLDKGGKLTCVKLEVYGCKTTKKGELSTTKETSSSKARPTRDQGVFDATPIHTYEMYDGNRYWVDMRYNGKKAGDGKLVDGIGCIAEKPYSADDPFTAPCWIGWHRNITHKPFILLKLHRTTRVTGLRMRIYVNKTMNALPFRNMRVLASNTTNLTTLGNLCALTNYQNESATIFDYHIRLETDNIRYIKLDFNYSADWFFLRYIEVLKTLTSNYSLSLSKTNNECVGKKSASIQTNDDESDWRIPVIVVVVLIFIVLLVFLLYRHRDSSWEDVRAKLHRHKSRGDDDEECKELAV